MNIGKPDSRTEKPDLQGLNALYDRWMFHPLHDAFFGHSDFYNYGYSTAATRSQKEACENLVEKLLAFLPENGARCWMSRAAWALRPVCCCATTSRPP